MAELWVDLMMLENWAWEHDRAFWNQVSRKANAYRAMLDYCEFVSKATSPDGVTYTAVKRGVGLTGRGRTLAAAVLAAVQEPTGAELDVV